MRTQVGIVGAGPAGLMLSHLLHLSGIESVVLESRSRDYVERRVRAGVLEQRSAELLVACGVGERMQREGLVHEGINLRFGGERHRIDFKALIGKTITVYGQQEVVKDLIARRLADGGDVRFEAEAATIDAVDTERPRIACREAGNESVIECDFVAGCDGSHGVSPAILAESGATSYARTYPFAWLGVLAATPPLQDELVYASHERGFALHSMRTPEISRLYLQVEADTELEEWPPSRIWEELRLRLDEPNLEQGEILESGISAMRGAVAEPMQHGRLFLAGDAAHIVPATGAKGLNLALRDVQVLASALAAWYRDGDAAPLDAYTSLCLRGVWRAQDFSSWMTGLLHRDPDGDPFEHRLRMARLAYLVSSRAAATSLAENYVGFEMDDDRE